MSTILFADNDVDFIKLRSPWLEKAGYKVIPTTTVEETREILVKGPELDLAIVDVRLQDNKNRQDESGLYLAHDIAAQGIPTLILTAFASYEFVRRAQTWFPDGTPAYMNFVDKREKRDPFLLAVNGSLRGRNVFMVHGHAEEARDKVESFIRKIGLVPILLQDQPSGGRTIFQQLEFYSNVAYVLVLLTPDDCCQEKGGELMARTRQNVIFELGYFIGKYTARRVKALVFGNLVLPSDIHGLLYVQVDDTDKWKECLVRELRSVGLRVNYP